MRPLTTPTNPLSRKLASHVRFGSEDEAMLEELWNTRQYFADSHRDIAREGDPPTGMRLIRSGWACRYKILDDGRRQIVGFCLPGDVCDFGNFVLRRMDHSLLALTPVNYVILGGAVIERLKAGFPRIVQALYWEGLVNAAIQREWTVNLGKRSALERFSHLICELHKRLEIIGMADERSFEFPITQVEMADALGLSSVHMNRTIRELRERQLVRLFERRIEILDGAALRKLALFDPLYLHIDQAG